MLRAKGLCSLLVLTERSFEPTLQLHSLGQKKPGFSWLALSLGKLGQGHVRLVEARIKVERNAAFLLSSFSVVFLQEELAELTVRLRVARIDLALARQRLSGAVALAEAEVGDAQFAI